MADFNWGSILNAALQTMQQQADKAYGDSVTLYGQKCAEWIDANLINVSRHLSLTPRPVKPQRTVYSIQGGQISQTLAPVDPGLQTPTLPTVETHPPDTFTVGVTQDAILALILQTVLAINAKLGA